MQAQIKARQQAQQWQDAVQDLHTWEESIKSKDEALKRHKASQAPTLAPPHAASHTYEHYRDKWDAFDVDAALACSDDDVAVQAPKPLLAPLHTRTLPRSMPNPTTALQWKEQGNTQFRNRRYTPAIESYTSSIKLEPTCVAYANRAMAHLKLNQHVEAEQDASRALELDNTYVKAWQRRAAARTALGRALEAAGDLERAVLLAPDNRALVAEYQAAVKGLEASGALTPAPPIHLEVTVQTHTSSQGLAIEGPAGEPNPAQVAPTPPAAQQIHSVVPAPVSHQAASLVRGALGPHPNTAQPPGPRAAPKTGVQFETQWRALKGDPGAQAALLVATSPTRLASLWKHGVTPDLLASVLGVLADHVAPDNPTHALSMVCALRHVPRIGVVMRLVPGAVVGHVVDALSLSAEHHEVLAVLGVKPTPQPSG